MKKIFSLVVCAGAMLMANAQVTISPTGVMDEIGVVAEGMSPDMQYVAGQNQLSNQPVIWLVADNEVKEYVYEGMFYPPLYDDETWEFIGYDYDNPQEDPYEGTFHAINNAGMAVGEFGSSYSDKMPCFANISSDTVTYLYMEDGVDAGGGAYALNADGSVIVGLYFDESWSTHACVWVNGGQTAADRIDLPAPTVEDFGGEMDYVAARWMSEDGSVILGYAQDAYTGSWVMIYWTKNSDGTYTVHSNHAKQYFTAYGQDENWNAIWLNPERPYAQFEPNGISANGEWVSLTIKPTFDLTDWFADEYTQAARLNLTTNVLEVLPRVADEIAAPIFHGIANNGTAAGATPMVFGPMAPAHKASSHKVTALAEGARNGMVWFAGEAVAKNLQELYPTEEYFNGELSEYAISGINADGTHIFGYTQSTDGVDSWVVTSFIAELPATTAVENVAEGIKAIKTIENGQVVITRDGVRYNALGIRL